MHILRACTPSEHFYRHIHAHALTKKFLFIRVDAEAAAHIRTAVITAYKRAMINSEMVHSRLWTRTQVTNSTRVKFMHLEHGAEQFHYGVVERFLTVTIGEKKWVLAELQTHRKTPDQPCRALTLVEADPPARLSYLPIQSIVCKAIFIENPHLRVQGKKVFAVVDCYRFWE